MTLPQFTEFVHIAEMVHAHERAATVIDLATVVSGAFAAKGKNPIKDHLTALHDAALGSLSNG